MRYAIVEHDSGIVTSLVEAQTIESLMLNVPEGCDPHPIGNLEVVPGQWRWTDDIGFLRVLTAITIEDARADRWAAVKARRDREQRGGCASPLGRVDTDAASQLKIAGAVQMAMIAQAEEQPFSVDWTMQDNSTVVHDAAAMIAMGVAVGRHISSCHEIALAKRGLIDVADDPAAVAAIDVDTGWPA